MAYEHKPGEVSIFKNEDRTADNQPEYKGSGMDANGNMVEIALWVKTSKAGKKYFFGKIQPPRERQAQAPPLEDEQLPF